MGSLRSFGDSRNVIGIAGVIALLTALVSSTAAFANDEDVPAVGSEQQQAVEQTAERDAELDPVSDPAENNPAADPVGAADPGLGFELTATPSAVAPGETAHFTSPDAPDGQAFSLMFEYLTWPSQGPAETTGPDFWGKISLGSAGPLGADLMIPDEVAPGEYMLHYTCGSGDSITCAGDLPFTVLGTVPDTEPEGVQISFAPDSLQGKPGDPVSVSGSCTYNGAAADAVEADWTYASTGEEARTQRIGIFALDSGGRLGQQLQVPADAKPWGQEIFKNGLSLSCDLGAVGVGLTGFEYAVQNTDDGPTIAPVPIPRPVANAPETLAATGWGQSALPLVALGLLGLAAGLGLMARTVRP